MPKLVSRLAAALILACSFLPAVPADTNARPLPSLIINHSAPARPFHSAQKRKSRRRSRGIITGRSYINVDGERVPSPRRSKLAPQGATARCGDGTYSFSRHRRGTCSHHGGVAGWL
jgi:hypothetical protein